jgi:hypothetical protein
MHAVSTREKRPRFQSPAPARAINPRTALQLESEAAGLMTNDERLKQEGKVHQASGKIKQATEKVVNKVRDSVKED